MKVLLLAALLLVPALGAAQSPFAAELRARASISGMEPARTHDLQQTALLPLPGAPPTCSARYGLGRQLVIGGVGLMVLGAIAGDTPGTVLAMSGVGALGLGLYLVLR
jgi:hypothetical protein